MGSFFTSVHVRHPNKKVVMKAVDTTQCVPAFVTDAENGWVTVFPQMTENQDYDLLINVTKALSRELKTPTVGTLVHDSDIFKFVVCEKGQVIDEYDSCPDYFDDSEQSTPTGGNPETLAAISTSGTTTAANFTELLKEEVTFAEDLAVEFARLLGISGDVATVGYTYAASGEFSGKLEPVGPARPATPPSRRMPERPAPTTAHAALQILAPKLAPGIYLKVPPPPTPELVEIAKGVLLLHASEAQITDLPWSDFVINRLTRAEVTNLQQLLSLSRADLLAMGKALAEQFANEVVEGLTPLGLQLKSQS